MLLAKIRGSRAELRSLAQSPVSLHRRSARRLDDGRFEVLAVLEPAEASLLEITGYDIDVTGDMKALLTRRLRTGQRADAALAAEDLFQSVSNRSGYMTVEYLSAWMANLPNVVPAEADVIELPNLTWESRRSYAVHLNAGDERPKPSVVFTSGVHAGELGGPDACVYFLYRLLTAWRNNTGLTLGKYAVNAAGVQNLLNNVDIYVFPCVNPDGRAYVFSALDWWRKNRNPYVGMGAVGVDINRNYDFLWSSGIGSSLFPQDDTYRGPAAFSEPETRNVDWLLRTVQAGYYMDIHGPSGTLVYTWGDAQDQSTNPSMNFQNAAWDGKRYTPYGEYLSASDTTFVEQLGNRVVSAANAVRQGSYECDPSYEDLYPTSATSDDYSFSRHLVDSRQSKTWSFTFEYGGADFAPAYEDMLPIIDETNAAMLDFCAAAAG